MAKTIINQDGDILNYSNISAIYVDDVPVNYARDIVEMEADEDEEAISELETEEFEDKDVYLLLADTITGMNYVLGEYDTLEEAEIARNKLVEWLQHEMYGVYDMKKEE